MDGSISNHNIDHVQDKGFRITHGTSSSFHKHARGAGCPWVTYMRCARWKSREAAGMLLK